MAMAGFEIRDGEYTKTIYGMIKEGRYGDAIAALSYIYDSHPTSRAALSLLAYCYFYTQVKLSSSSSRALSMRSFIRTS